jgi:DNA-binding MarR family transcriptional regulator
MTIGLDQMRGLARFRHGLRRFLAASESISRGAGITTQQYQALLAMKTWLGPAMTMKDLAEELLLSHHGAVQMVNRLCSAGLAERMPSHLDRRSVFLKLTTTGDAMVEELATQHLAEMERQEPLLAESLKRLRDIPRASLVGGQASRIT